MPDTGLPTDAITAYESWYQQDGDELGTSPSVISHESFIAGWDAALAAAVPYLNPAETTIRAERERWAAAIREIHKPEPGQHPDFCGECLGGLPCRTLRIVADLLDGGT